MFFRISITFLATLPFYIGAIWILSHSFHTQFKRVISLFALSTLSTIPLFLLSYAGLDSAFISSAFGPLFAVILLAFMEELLKSLIWFFPKLEGISRLSKAIAIGLGFAFFENIHYFWDLDFSGVFLLVAFFRLVVDSTAHTVFAAIFGTVLDHGKRKVRVLYYMGALLSSGSAHALFNLLHHWELSYLAVPFLILLIFLLHEEKVWFPEHVQVGRHHAKPTLRLRSD